MSSQVNKRKEKDLMRLLVSDYEVEVPNENNSSEFVVTFNGPKNSPYEGVSLILELIEYRDTGE